MNAAQATALAEQYCPAIVWHSWEPRAHTLIALVTQRGDRLGVEHVTGDFVILKCGSEEVLARCN